MRSLSGGGSLISPQDDYSLNVGHQFLEFVLFTFLEIAYGTLSGGSTMTFFRDSKIDVYKKVRRQLASPFCILIQDNLIW